MMITIYIIGATRVVTVTEPDLTNKALIEVNIPEGFPIRFLLQQLQSLSNSLIDEAEQASNIIIKVNYGSL